MYYYKIYDWLIKSEIRFDFLELEKKINSDKKCLELKYIDLAFINFSKNIEITNIINENVVIYDTNLGYLIKYYDNIILVSSYFIYFQKEQNIEMQMEIFLTLGITLLFIQRGIIPFHGAGITLNKNLFIISADSNSGKSTLLYNLLKKGYKLCADDLVPIEIIKNSCNGILSNCSYIKLWDDTIKKYNIKNKKIEIIYKTGKYRVLFKNNIVKTNSGQLPINEIVILNTKYDGENIVIRELEGLEKLIKMIELTHGYVLFKELLNKNLFKQYMILKKNIKITEWKYNKNYKNLDLLVKMILERGHNG